MAYSERVKLHLSKSAINVQDLIDTTFYYQELEQIAQASASDIIKFTNERKMAAPVFTKKKIVKEISEKPKRQHFSTKKLKLVSNDLTYAERLAKTGYKKRTWKIRDRD